MRARVCGLLYNGAGRQVAETRLGASKREDASGRLFNPRRPRSGFQFPERSELSRCIPVEWSREKAKDGAGRPGSEFGLLLQCWQIVNVLYGCADNECR